MIITKQPKVTTGEWIDALKLCEEIIHNKNLHWAHDRVLCIRDWIKTNEFVTEKQMNNLLNVNSHREYIGLFPADERHWDCVYGYQGMNFFGCEITDYY